MCNCIRTTITLGPAGRRPARAYDDDDDDLGDAFDNLDSDDFDDLDEYFSTEEMRRACLLSPVSNPCPDLREISIALL